MRAAGRDPRRVLVDRLLGLLGGLLLGLLPAAVALVLEQVVVDRLLGSLGGLLMGSLPAALAAVLELVVVDRLLGLLPATLALVPVMVDRRLVDKVPVPGLYIHIVRWMYCVRWM